MQIIHCLTISILLVLILYNFFGMNTLREGLDTASSDNADTVNTNREKLWKSNAKIINNISK